jgi:glyoxylase-like metal-dependent hydrolase (beta-lactamase superfamily II)
LSDLPLSKASAQVAAAAATGLPMIQSFFDEATFTVSYVVSDPQAKVCAIIDSVLDFDAAAGRTSTSSADQILTYIAAEGLTVAWLLETHAHADHLSGAPYLQARVGGKLAIGKDIVEVQKVFGKVFNAGTEFARDGSEFDRLFDDGDEFAIGSLNATVLHVPGHTPADVAYVIGDAAFVGDTLFMPDYGTARTDFPGGDAHQLFRSIRRLLSLPEQTRIFLCHDYKAPGREEFVWETTVAAQRAENVHVRDDVSEEDFVAMRQARDSGLGMPKLILPSVQVNIRGGKLPEPEDNGVRYLKIPLDKV